MEANIIDTIIYYVIPVILTLILIFLQLFLSSRKTSWYGIIPGLLSVILYNTVRIPLAFLMLHFVIRIFHRSPGNNSDLDTMKINDL